jgi:hypothetical protein
VLKRDNGGNMNHLAINEVLSESFVLPLMLSPSKDEPTPHRNGTH